jgi:hypothetical protein
MTIRSSLRPASRPTEREIQEQAYHLWIEGGCLEGVELGNWLAAEELLRHRHGHVRGRAYRGSHPGRDDSPSTRADQ